MRIFASLFESTPHIYGHKFTHELYIKTTLSVYVCMCLWMGGLVACNCLLCLSHGAYYEHCYGKFIVTYSIIKRFIEELLFTVPVPVHTTVCAIHTMTKNECAFIWINRMPMQLLRHKMGSAISFCIVEREYFPARSASKRMWTHWIITEQLILGAGVEASKAS